MALTYPGGYHGPMSPDLDVQLRAGAPSVITLDPEAKALERRGRWWMIVSFLACPCHLPWTLAILGTVLGGTAIGAALREHTILAGVVIASVWALGTARGFWLVRKAEKGDYTCAPTKRRGFRRTPSGSADPA